MAKQPGVYILASKRNGTLYIGVTTGLPSRMAAHHQGLVAGFTARYSVRMLVYYEMFDTVEDAIAREKRLKHWRRRWKIRLIEEINPEWENLYDPDSGEIFDHPADRERLTRPGSEEPFAPVIDTRGI